MIATTGKMKRCIYFPYIDIGLHHRYKTYATSREIVTDNVKEYYFIIISNASFKVFKHNMSQHTTIFIYETLAEEYYTEMVYYIME